MRRDISHEFCVASFWEHFFVTDRTPEIDTDALRFWVYGVSFSKPGLVLAREVRALGDYKIDANASVVKVNETEGHSQCAAEHWPRIPNRARLMDSWLIEFGFV